MGSENFFFFFTPEKHSQEALKFDTEDAMALIALARLYLMNDDLDQCQYTCMSLLRNDKENEEATIMMADLAFRYFSAKFLIFKIFNLKKYLKEK